MENILKSIFDYQRFENSARLSSLICTSEERYARELAEAELAFVAAAGEIRSAAENREK